MHELSFVTQVATSDLELELAEITSRFKFCHKRIHQDQKPGEASPRSIKAQQKVPVKLWAWFQQERLRAAEVKLRVSLKPQIYVKTMLPQGTVWAV